MNHYILHDKNGFLKLLKIEAAKAGMTMKDFLIKAVKEKIQRNKK